MNTAIVYFTWLPRLTSRAQELKLAIGFWMTQYQEARQLSNYAWNEYNAAIDCNAPGSEIDERYAQSCILEDIAIDAWGKWQQTKAELLALSN